MTTLAHHSFTLQGATLMALASGALYWPKHSLLCVSDLHLGKAGRRARRGEALLPPYETRDTLARLEQVLKSTKAQQVICLGDSFDDLAAASALPEDEIQWLSLLQAGRKWIWIEGNHDPGPVAIGGTHLAEYTLDALTFRHIAQRHESAEISGHYHPKAQLALRGRTVSKPAFLVDHTRVIMPAFGTYTGGLRSTDPALSTLMDPGAVAILTGTRATPVPMPR
ncbi:MAG: ligase-associated DNA damage response endonuclease PdeM [Roseovarius sp.]